MQLEISTGPGVFLSITATVAAEVIGMFPDAGCRLHGSSDSMLLLLG